MSALINIEEHLLRDKIATAYAAGFYEGTKQRKTRAVKTEAQLTDELNARGRNYAESSLAISKKLADAMKSAQT